MASYVVTGGGRGVGRAIVERLAADHDTVAVIEFDAAALDWAATHPAAPRIVPVIGDAADPAVAARAAAVAAAASPLVGWVAHDVMAAAHPRDLEAVPLQSANDPRARDGGK